MTAKSLMIVGTMSSSGKSLLVTALCRIFARKGIKVAPFKAQNMSNNAAICADGGEIGRAQALQAIAAGLEPDVNMNPVLIKPEADSRSQVILMGKPWSQLHASSFYEKKALLWEYVKTSLDHMHETYELLIIEGAGSPVELNLKRGDIVNMAVAKYLDAPTLIVGDIDRGGIFAQLLGTLWLMSPEEQALVKGLVVNKFRGDMALFEDGMNLLEEKSGRPLLGVVPYLRDLDLPDEDATSLEIPKLDVDKVDAVDIAVIHLPHISNFDDFDPLKREGGVNLRFVRTLAELGNPNAIILPGTKSTIADLDWLRDQGLDRAIVTFAEDGGTVVGICGGYQILGQTIADPDHIESEQDEVHGLGLLATHTVFKKKKETSQTYGVILQEGLLPSWLETLRGTALKGYEIHAGVTQTENPWLVYTKQNKELIDLVDGAFAGDGRILGCYLHDLFVNEAFRHAWLARLGWDKAMAKAYNLDEAIDNLADRVEASLDMDLLEKLIWG